MNVRARLDELYALGGGEGANRPGLSAEEQAAHDLVEGWMREAGLRTSHDRAGNLYGRREGRAPDLPELWIGSHLDSVPRGGRYDGALGVVGALAAVARLEEAPARTIAVVAFRDEEGSRFGQGFFGSRAVTGTLEPGTLARLDPAGVSVRAALAERGFDAEEQPGWLAPPPAAYVELHIEQGAVLASQDAPLGVVESIVGLVELEVRFEGREGHAGTTPMDARQDAGLCAAAFQLAAADCARAIPDAVATVGWIVLEPGSGNVVPRLARLVVDARAPDRERLDRLEAALREAADRTAAAYRCEVTITRSALTEPVAMAPIVVDALREAAPAAPVLPSGAGHDAQVLGAAGVPVGMLFARSLAGGISHSPLEATADEDVETAVQALTRALPALCERLGAAAPAAASARLDRPHAAATRKRS
jgi:allantoate deiminase